MLKAGELFSVILSRDFPTDMNGVPTSKRCPHCGKVLYHKGLCLAGKVIWCPEPEACTCTQALAEMAAEKAREVMERENQKRNEKQEKIKKLLGTNGIGKRFYDMTFSNFTVTMDNQFAFSSCKDYSAKGGEQGLFIYGMPGVGKTHLAAAIAHETINRGNDVIFTTVLEMLNNIKSTFGGSYEQQSSVIRAYKKTELLILDDIGKEVPTGWVVSKLFEILNNRYDNYLPVVVTSNYPLDGLAQRLGGDMVALSIVDRLQGMCTQVKISGRSWRKK